MIYNIYLNNDCLFRRYFEPSAQKGEWMLGFCIAGVIVLLDVVVRKLSWLYGLRVSPWITFVITFTIIILQIKTYFVHVIYKNELDYKFANSIENLSQFLSSNLPLRKV